MLHRADRLVARGALSRSLAAWRAAAAALALERDAALCARADAHRRCRLLRAAFRALALAMDGVGLELGARAAQVCGLGARDLQ